MRGGLGVTIPRVVPKILRRVVPKEVRIRLRRSATVRGIAALLLKGTAHQPLPESRFEVYYDAYRNVGLGADLDGFEVEERRMVRKLLTQERPKVIWDVGANIGVWSLFLTSLCGDDAEIRCFEPEPDNLKILQLNMTSNQIANWIIRPVALSNREGAAEFFTDPVCGSTGTLMDGRDFIGEYYGARRGKIQVRLTTVDHEVAGGARPPQFIKIDVEGHELAVLEGARKTLREHRPLLIFEATENQAEIGAFFKELDYQLLDLEGKPLDAPLFNTIAAPRERGLACRSAS
jgi:FkbM family methyltransferase